MGNAGNHGTRERAGKAGDTAPPSPREHAEFNFDKKLPQKSVSQGSHDEDSPLYTKMSNTPQDNFEVQKRQRSATVSEGTKAADVPRGKVLPTVFKWEGGGKQVFICGSFSDWKVMPMVKSHGDFVTIIDLPEGEHQYKFCVDGEMKCDLGTKLKEDGSGKTNVISVKDSDFEVFQALARDSENTSGDLQSDYCQEIPTTNIWEKQSGPPILPPHLLQVILNKDTPLSGKQRKTRKVMVTRFAQMKKMISSTDSRIKESQRAKIKKKPNENELKIREVPQVSSALFFQYNTQLGPPYHILVDTNFINFSIKNKLDVIQNMMDCLYAKCIPYITDCVMAEMEKLGSKYRVALKIMKDSRFERLACMHKGTYADDCLVQRVTQHKCYIVATNDKDLKRRIRKIPGVPIMYVSQHRYTIERMPDAYGAPKT